MSKENKSCLTCSLYWTCKDKKKSKAYSCKSYRSLESSSDEPIEFDLSQTNEAKAGRILSASGFSSLSNGVPEINEDNSFKQELKLEKIWDEVLNSKNRVPPDLKVDDRDLKEYPNFFEFVTNKDGLGNVGVPFPRQLWFITSLLSEACGNPKCTKPEWWDVEKVPIKVDSLHDLLEIVTFYEYGVCPKCKGRKSKHYKKKLIKYPSEGYGCVGQRAGKSVTLSMLAAYILHRYLKMQSPTRAFGLLKGSILSAAFVALTFQKAVNLLWNPITNMIMDSKWFQEYHTLLDHYENKFSTKLYQKPGGIFLQYRHRDLNWAPSGPSKRTLRGDTRHFYIIDEAGLFPIEGNVDDKERMSIFETHTSLKNSAMTIRNAARELFLQGYDNMPNALGVYISSPMSQRDFIMRGVKENADNRKAVVLHLPTWKFNPKMKEKQLRSEFKNDPVKFERDFGANPPLSESTFIDIGANAEKVFSGPPNKVDYVYKIKKDPRQRLKQKWAEPVNMRAGWNAPPTIMALDAGAVNNSFALSIGHPVVKQLNRRSWVVGMVDVVVEVAPTPRQSEVNFNRLCTDLLFKLIEKFNVGAVVTDRWQNLKLLDDLMAKYSHLVTETYSLTYEDCVTFKEHLLDDQPKIILPKPEMTFDEIDLIDTSLNYPHCFKYKPIAHTFFQLKTVQDNGLKVDKGPGFTDDCLRSTMLLTTYLHDFEWCKNNLKAQRTNANQQAASGGYVAGRSLDSPVQSRLGPGASGASPSVGVGTSRGGIMTHPTFRR